MELVTKGKKMLIAVIVANLVISVFTIAIYASLLNTIGETSKAAYELAQGLFRFVLECLMFLFIFKGHRWARIVAMVLFGLGGVFALLMVFRSGYLMLFMAILYILSFIVLLSKSVKAYQRYKKHGAMDDNSKA